MEQPDEPPQQAGPPLVRLEYYSAGPPDRWPHAGRWGFLLALGWWPFACGVVSRQAVILSGAPEVIRSHVIGGFILMGAELLVSLVCFLVFLQHRHGIGMSASVGVIVLQGSILACIAFGM